uniref:COMM domain containing 4 n=1 Tax=Pan troglodytes TaxID=9598 RepID=A0A2I3TKR9_PANTR
MSGTRGPCWAAVWETHGSWPHLRPPSSLITCLPSLQRFRFCGDLDCPDWVLAEISTLAKMSSVKLRLLCSQVLKELLGQGIDPGWSRLQ